MSKVNYFVSRILPCLVLGFFSVSCSDSQFSSSSSASNSTTKNTDGAEKTGLETTGQDATASADHIGAENTVTIQETLKESTQESHESSDGLNEDSDKAMQGVSKRREEECLFAVSGTWIGFGDHGSTFPLLLDKKTSPQTLGRFDNVGGIYLAAREQPYIFGQGQKEIDDAIKFTFDSILIGPGMRAEIKDAQNKLLYSGTGPVIGESAFYAQQEAWTGRYRQKLIEVKANLPQWMQKVLDVNANPIQVIELHQAHSVKVSAVLGGQCDNER